MLKPILLTMVTSYLLWQPVQAVQLTACSHAMSQTDITTCYSEQYKAADAELNRVYKVIRQNLSKAEREKLVEAQRAWIPFRDKNCEHQTFSSANDSLHTAYKNGCLANVTAARTLELQYIYPNLFGTLPATPAAPVIPVLPAPTPQPITVAPPADAIPAPTRPPVATTKPVKPMPNPNQLTAQSLLGNWQTVETGYGMEVRFNSANGVNTFNSYLNSTPFETGTWSMNNGVLTIAAPNGQALYVYNKVTLDNGILTLYEQQGGVEHYRKMQ